MLAYILALAVGLGSLGIYLAAFFLPEVHRKSDFYWSGVGLFYALMLWVCAGRITGGVLIGQIAGVALLGWFGWQTLTLRRSLVPAAHQTELPSKEAATEAVRSQTAKLQSNLSNVSLPSGISQLPQRIAASFDRTLDLVRGSLDKAKKPKVKPTATKPQPVTPPTAATGEAFVPPIPTIVAPMATPTVEPLKTYPEVKAVETSTSIESIIPEVELAPPAEPLGIGNPADRKSSEPDITPIAEPSATMTVVTPESISESSRWTEEIELKRPNSPDPKLVEEAVEDAQAKNLPSSPPDL